MKIRTAVFEFMARGLIWARILILGILMPTDEYGLLLVYLAAEGLIAAVSSYPLIKEVLVSHDVGLGVYKRFCVVAAAIAAPACICIIFLAKAAPWVAAILLAAAFFNGLSQVAIYVLRVASIPDHNRVKVAWSVLTTVMFLVLLPQHWAWLPLIYMVGAIWVVVSAYRVGKRSGVTPAREENTSHHLRGWLIYGTQAIMLSMPQHGIRLFVAATMVLAEVARFTQFYMLATASTFLIAAVMITFEAELSKAAGPAEIRARFRKAAIAGGISVLITVLYSGGLMVIDAFGVIAAIFGISLSSDLTLIIGLFVFNALSALRVVANALTLAAAGRAISLLATTIGMIGLGVGLIVFTANWNLGGVGLALAFGQVLELLVLTLFLVFATKRNAADRS